MEELVVTTRRDAWTPRVLGEGGAGRMGRGAMGAGESELSDVYARVSAGERAGGGRWLFCSVDEKTSGTILWVCARSLRVSVCCNGRRWGCGEG